MVFFDRGEAGRRLATAVDRLALDSPEVLALPRGGVPVAAEIARVLGAPLDVFVARKIGAPGRPEYGIGAIAELSDEVVWSRQAARSFDLSAPEISATLASERRELERRVERYRAGRSLPDLNGADVVVVDDGLATGVTAEAAVRSILGLEPRRVVLAVPVAAADAVARLSTLVEVQCLSVPDDFRAVGLHYDDFDQVTDEEVIASLRVR